MVAAAMHTAHLHDVKTPDRQIRQSRVRPIAACEAPMPIPRPGTLPAPAKEARCTIVMPTVYVAILPLPLFILPGSRMPLFLRLLHAGTFMSHLKEEISLPLLPRQVTR